MNNEEKITLASAAEETSDEKFPDLPECFRPVAEKYGREMFALVYDAGMCAQATQVLAVLAQKHGSRGGLHAVRVLADAFNQISSAYAKQMGWEEGILTQCDRDIGMAFQHRIVVPGQSIILDS